MLKEIATITFFVICLTPFAWYQYESWRMDRTKLLTDLMSPVRKRVTDYYQEYKQPPTPEESVRFVEDTGCKMTEHIDFKEPPSMDRRISSYCLFKEEVVWVRIDYEISDTDFPYSISLNLMKTQCDLSIKTNKADHKLAIREISCRNEPLISFRQ